MIVVFFRGRWRLYRAGKWRESFDFQVDAVEQAFQWAERIRNAGHDCAVFVQDRFGEIRPHPEVTSADPTRLVTQA